RILAQHLAHADDGIEGRAQLVAHVGEKLGLVLARLGKLAALVFDLVEQPCVLNGQHGLRREGLKSSDDLGGEYTQLTPQDDEAAQYPLFSDKRNREERAQALSDEEGPCLRRDELPLVGDVGDLDGLPDRTSPTDRAFAEPDRFRPYDRQVLPRYPVRAPRLKGLRTLVELVDDAAVASGQLNGAADDGLEHGLELERGADGSADLTERAKLRDRPGEFACARLHLVEQPHVLDRDNRLVGEGRRQLDLF